MSLASLRASLPVAIALSLLLVALARVVPGPAHAEGATPPSKVGIVNIQKLFLSYAKVAELQKALEEEYKSEEAKLARQLTVLEERRKELEGKGWNEADPTFRDKLRDIALEYDQHKVLVELKKVEFQEKSHRTTEELYNALVKRIGDYARANGFALVFKVLDIPEETFSDKALAKKIDSKEILFHDASIDITDAMIKLVNADR